MMKAWILVFALILIPPALAFECSDVSVDCSEFENLTEDEKDLVISNLIYDSKLSPNYNIISDWNTNLEYDEDGRDRGQIKDAWIKIINLEPSVAINNTLFIPTNTEILTKHDYKVQIPNNYYASYPSTSYGDCKRTYSLVDNSNSVKHYNNDNLINSEFEPTENNNIRSDLNINVKTKVNHYRWDEYCCGHRDDDGECDEYCGTCEFSHSNYLTNSLTVSDEIQATKYDKQPEIDFKVIDNDYNLKAKFTPSDFTRFELTTPSAYYQDYKVFYDLSWTDEDIITLKSNDYETSDVNNLVMDKQGDTYYFTVKDHDCTIKLDNHFYSYSYDCNLYSDNPNLSISTDHLVYDANEIINVDLKPDDIFIEVNYADTTKVAKDQVSFTAKELQNKITASYNDHSTEKVIYVKAKDKWNLFFNLSIFSGINYVLYQLLKKYWGVFL